MAFAVEFGLFYVLLGIMVPQYFPWLFDDKDAWEKAISDPRYNYDLPVDYFMSIYREYRTGATSLPSYSLNYSPSVLPVAAFQAPAVSTAMPLSVTGADSILSSFTNTVSAEPETKSDDSILSQSEIDALLAGLQ